jgi:hypothetical protein
MALNLENIDPRFVDVDFEKAAKLGGYSLGYAGVGSAVNRMRAYKDVVPTLSDSAIRAAIEAMDAAGGGAERLVTRIYDQNGEGSCHSADTEVLTESGWVAWPDYNWSDPLGTMNPVSGLLEFQRPLQKHVYDYDGEMVYSTNRSVDFAVTSNHRMLVRPWIQRERAISNQYQFVEAGQLGWYVGLPHAPSGFIGTELVKVAIDGDREYLGDDFAAFLGLVASDGWAGNSEFTRNRVSFCCFNGERQGMIRDLAARIGFREQPGRPGVWYRQDAPALAEWLRANLYGSAGCGAKNKRVPLIIKAASRRQIEIFLRYFGDQSHTREKGAQYYTSSKGMADDLQELALRTGKRASIGKREPRTSHIGGRAVTDSGSFVVTQWHSSELGLIRKRQIETERYKGPVYCATVPNSTLITRRNGTVLISGNCVANACSQANEIIQALQFGKENVVHLSAMSLYKRIGSGPNSGAMVSDGLDEMQARGVLPLDTPENRAKFGDKVMPNCGWRTPYPDGWEAVAKGFCVVEAFVLRGMSELLTALVNQHPVVVGRAGHSICYCRPVWKSGYNVVYANSWGNWGFAAGDFEHGFGLDSSRMVSSSAGWAFAVRSVVVRSNR